VLNGWIVGKKVDLFPALRERMEKRYVK